MYRVDIIRIILLREKERKRKKVSFENFFFQRPFIRTTYVTESSFSKTEKRTNT